MCDELESWWFDEEYCTWYEGYLPGLPSTSNNIESFHLKSIKAKSKLSKRLPTIQFLNVMLTVMKNWSLDRTAEILNAAGNSMPNPNLKFFATKPNISKDDYLSAHQWNKLDKQIRFIRSAGIYMVKSHKQDKKSTAECRAYLAAVKDFSSFSALLSDLAFT
jgi:hypothetical protein